MEHAQSIELKPFNTFGVEAQAEHYIAISSLAGARDVLRQALDKPVTILGGGSNTLFVRDVPGTVMHNQMKGIRTIEETEQSISVQVGAGEDWHAFVSFCVERGYGGIENLALIPGTVGASPVQNIGAYGAEVKDTITQVQALYLADGKERIFSNQECDFSYRSSVFKESLKGQYLITSVVFRLAKHPVLNTSYGSIQTQLEKHAGDPTTWTIKHVFDAVVDIRKAKLPDPSVIGNAGSFFKNPIIDKKTHDVLLTRYPNMPSYELPDNHYKIPAGWLVETAGWKKIKRGPIGVYEKQALVITHSGEASGMDIYKFSEEIRRSIIKLFNITLEREINIVPVIAGAE